MQGASGWLSINKWLVEGGGGDRACYKHIPNPEAFVNQKQNPKPQTPKPEPVWAGGKRCLKKNQNP